MKPIDRQRLAHQKRQANDWVNIESTEERQDVGKSYLECTVMIPETCLVYRQGQSMVNLPGHAGDDRGRQWPLRQ